MKLTVLKKVFALATATMLTVSGYATTTGDIIFRTVNANTSLGKIFNVDGTTPLSGTGFSAQLWGGTTSDSTTFTALGTPETFATSAPFLGYVGAGSTFGPAAQDYTVSGSTGGQTFFYQVRAWNNQGGTVTTYASAAVKAQSAVIQTQLGGIDANDTVFSPPNANGFTNFALVPEPSVLALGLLGGALLIFRRRK